MASPHILLITCDELRADLLPCYGGDLIATPHLDALAAGGLVCDAAYAPSPVCLPSRCSILTGQHPHRHGAYSNFREERLDPRRPNLYNLLRGAGYHTAHVGKCHYTAAPYHLTRRDATIDREPVKDFYLSLGLDHLDLNNGKNNSIWFWNDYSRELEGAGLLATYRETVWANQSTGKTFAFPGPQEWHPDWWCMRKAVDHLRTCDPAKPTFLWVSFPGPHYPHDPPAAYLDRVDASRLPLLRGDPAEFARRDRMQFDAFHGNRGWRGCEGMPGFPGGYAALGEADWRRIQHHYLANIALLDDLIGRTVAEARARLGDDLVVIVTADHGDNMGAHRLWAKNACCYDEVLRVPFVVHGGGFATGRSASRVGLIDLLPTCCELAGLDVPPRRDGRSLRTSLADGGHGIMVASMDRLLIVHDERWKLSIDQQDGLHELYDRASDPGEYVNRIDDPAARDDRMRLEQAAIRSLMTASLG
jgi:arylsulfatase A-like enzyme